MKQERVFTDQLNRKVKIKWPPSRIISLVPSQTELLVDLDLQDELIGLTKFCIHPKEIYRSTPRIGGTKKIRFDKISKLNPDLIIGNKEENEKSPILQLEESFPVWLSDIHDLEDALDMMEGVGNITDRKEKASNLISNIRERFQQIEPLPHAVTTAYFIWRKPYMVAGSNTFINHILNKLGMVNVFEEIPRYPMINKRELQEKKPELILLSSEPYPFKERHFEELKSICPDSKVQLVDGEMFSWYGSRLLKAAPYLIKCVNNWRNLR